MITFAKITNRLGAALHDFGEALTAALAWVEEGDAFQPFTAASKQPVLSPVARLDKSAPVR